jgi:hypothetical protein
MSLRDLSTELINRGIPVIPVEANSKRTRLTGWPDLATTNPEAIEQWSATFPGANSGAVAKMDIPNGVVIIDCDVHGLPERIERETGKKIPATFTVISAGKRCPHLYFRHTAASRLLGNRKMVGQFDLKAHNAYVVGPGSAITTDGGTRTYDISDPAPIVPIPDWLCAWIEKNTQSEKLWDGPKSEVAISERFDIHDFLDHYGLTYEMKGNWYITNVCPVAGHKHEQSTFTGFYYDGNSFGFKCFAANCPGSSMSVGDVVKHLNKPKDGMIVQPYGGEIWPASEKPLDPEIVNAEWFVPWPDFKAREIKPRKSLLIDSETEGTVLFSESLNQVFSYRGIGKSLFVAGLVNTLLHGGDFLRYKSPGGFSVLYCDGELPDKVLQDRLREQLHGAGGRLTLMHAGSLPNQSFPRLSDPRVQSEFVKRVDKLNPDIIVFDTLSACFRFDTNDPEGWERVNQFYISLRLKGKCVIVVHHAGKNGSQRGRTDGDDNLDLAIRLDAPKGWAPGDGCKFNLSYEKVRAASRLREFYAEYDEMEGWTMPEPTDEAEVVKLHMEGKSVRSIAKTLELSTSKVQRAIDKARKSGKLDEEVK